MESYMNAGYTTRYKCCNGWTHIHGDNGCSHSMITVSFIIFVIIIIIVIDHLKCKLRIIISVLNELRIGRDIRTCDN